MIAAESCALQTVRNALRSFQQLSVVDIYTQDGIKMLRMEPVSPSDSSNSSHIRLEQIIQHLDDCRLLNMI